MLRVVNDLLFPRYPANLLLSRQILNPTIIMVLPSPLSGSPILFAYPLKADIQSGNVRFTPESGHPGRGRCTSANDPLRTLETALKV